MRELLWIGFLVAVYLVLKYRPDWFNQVVVAVAGKAIGRVAMASQPDAITLAPMAGSPASAMARSAVDGLSERGFTPAGSYTIPEMRGLPVHFLVREKESAIAVVYEHPQAGVWTDIVCRYDDGSHFGVTNARTGGSLESQPGHTTIRKPGSSVGALYLTFQRERPAGALVGARVDDVTRIFADAYAKETAWRKGRGVSKAEVRNVARESSRDGNRRAPAA